MKHTNFSKKWLLLGLGLGLGLGAWYLNVRQAQAQQTQKIVDYVDPQKLLGSWYELARLPNIFQKDDWVGAQDHYQLSETGLKVRYTYHEKSFEAPEKGFDATMWRDKQDEPTGKFKYQAIWPFVSDYWVIDLDPNYEYLVVGFPDRSMLWIMSRSPELPDDVYQQIVSRAQTQGYDTSRLIRVPQRSEANTAS